MTSDPSPRPISPLRARVIEDMTVRGFAPKRVKTTSGMYKRLLPSSAAGPTQAAAEDLRRFQLYQTESGMQPPSINSAVAALRFFFTVTLDRPNLSRRLTIVRYSAGCRRCRAPRK